MRSINSDASLSQSGAEILSSSAADDGSIGHMVLSKATLLSQILAVQPSFPADARAGKLHGTTPDYHQTCFKKSSTCRGHDSGRVTRSNYIERLWNIDYLADQVSTYRF
jgi:hypothetical protein